LPALLPAATSLVRLVLGAAAIAGMVPPGDSLVPLAVVSAAAATDFADGRIARALGRETTAGRLVDNLCDFGFLSCIFVFDARAALWSPPVWGRLARHWAAVNDLPVLALTASFGLYFVRLSLALRAGHTPGRSARGHAAGIANYGLAFAGAAAMLPGMAPMPGLLEPVMLGVVLLNVAAVVENLALLFPRQPGGPRMRA